MVFKGYDFGLHQRFLEFLRQPWSGRTSHPVDKASTELTYVVCAPLAVEQVSMMRKPGEGFLPCHGAFQVLPGITMRQTARNGQCCFRYIFQSYIFGLLTISFFERHSDANALVSCAAPTYPIVASQHEFKSHPKHILVLGVQRALGFHVRSPAL